MCECAHMNNTASYGMAPDQSHSQTKCLGMRLGLRHVPLQSQHSNNDSNNDNNDSNDSNTTVT